jgi:hypothetical protein
VLAVLLEEVADDRGAVTVAVEPGVGGPLAAGVEEAEEGLEVGLRFAVCDGALGDPFAGVRVDLAGGGRPLEDERVVVQERLREREAAFAVGADDVEVSLAEVGVGVFWSEL